MDQILIALLNLSTLVFVVTGMLAMGLSFTFQQIGAPLKNTGRVILALLINFVLVPISAYLITLAIPLSDGLKIGLILVSTAAGAPFLPKLAQAAKGDISFSVGLMVLLMVASIIYMPLVLPLVLDGVTVDPWEIAQSLIILMLLPLVAGLFIEARYEKIAEILQSYMAQTSTFAIILLMVTGLLSNLTAILVL